MGDGVFISHWDIGIGQAAESDALIRHIKRKLEGRSPRL
jgi:hypothetical protein